MLLRDRVRWLMGPLLLLLLPLRRHRQGWRRERGEQEGVGVVVGLARRCVGLSGPRRGRSSRRLRRRVYRDDWGTIRCSLRRRSGRGVRRGLGLVGARRGCGLGWSLGKTLRGGERRGGMLILESVVVFDKGHEGNFTGYTK